MPDGDRTGQIGKQIKLHFDARDAFKLWNLMNGFTLDGRLPPVQPELNEFIEGILYFVDRQMHIQSRVTKQLVGLLLQRRDIITDYGDDTDIPYTPYNKDFPFVQEVPKNNDAKNGLFGIDLGSARPVNTIIKLNGEKMGLLDDMKKMINQEARITVEPPPSELVVHVLSLFLHNPHFVYQFMLPAYVGNLYGIRPRTVWRVPYGDKEGLSEDEKEGLLLVKKDEGTYQKLKDELKGVRTFNNKTWEKITMDYGKYGNTVSNFNYVRAIRGFVILGMNLSSHSSKSILEYLDSNPTEKTSYISSKIFVDYFFHLQNEINRFISNSP